MGRRNPTTHEYTIVHVTRTDTRICLSARFTNDRMVKDCAFFHTRSNCKTRSNLLEYDASRPVSDSHWLRNRVAGGVRADTGPCVFRCAEGFGMGIEKHSLRESVEANARLALAFLRPSANHHFFLVKLQPAGMGHAPPGGGAAFGARRERCVKTGTGTTR